MVFDWFEDSSAWEHGGGVENARIICFLLSGTPYFVMEISDCFIR